MEFYTETPKRHQMKSKIYLSIMANNGKRPECFLRFFAILLIYMQVVNSQGLPEISDMIAEFSYTDGEMNHLREKRDVNTDILEYIVIIEVNVSHAILFERIKSSLESISSFQIDNTTEIESVNITTVCHPNGSEYQCICEDQYVWSFSNCIMYNACNDLSEGVCTCIDVFPSDGQMCVTPSERPFVDILVEIELNTTSTTLLDELRNHFGELSFPINFFHAAEITDVVITTVCSLNGTEYQCTCEDQYFWPCEKCRVYGSCGNVTNSSCGCINALPYDGHFCQPISELMNNSRCPTEPPPAEYLIEIEISAVDVTVLNQLRNSLKTLSLPSIKNTINITEINITTVCSLNGTKYQCRCEDQYFWSCETCKLYGSCGNVTNSSCGCINAIPKDGHFCQPISELMNNSTCPTEPPPAEYLIEIEIRAVDVTVLNQLKNILKTLSLPSINSTINITEINITTVCSLNGTEYQCRCEDQYFWPCEKCKLYGSCGNVTNSSCDCIKAIPNDGHFCQPIYIFICPAVTTGIQVLSFSLTINEVFDFALTDQSSEKFKIYKQKISSSIDNIYRTLHSYEPNSATVTAFRPGSVITDFTISTTSATLDLASANQDLAKSLRLQGFDVSDNAFIQSVKDGLYESSGNIYPGTSLTLTCNPPVNNGIEWTLDGKSIVVNSNNTLQLDNVTPDNSGQYACTTTVNSMPYVIWQIITIQPYPNIQVSTSKVVQCKDTTIPLQCCVQEMYQVEWSIYCTSPSTGSPAGCILCDYTIKQNDCQNAEQEIQVTCKLKNPINGITTQSYNSKSITISVSNKTFSCSDNIFGAGNLGDVHSGDCNKEMVGYQVALCNSANLWQPTEDYCVLRIFANLKDEAENLQVAYLPQFMANVRNNAILQIQNITDSPATILTIVEILKIISSFSQTIFINQPVMMNFLQTTDVIGSDDARDTWVLLNKNSTTTNTSSELLNSTESIARRLTDDSISIITNMSSLNKTSMTAPFSGTFGKNLTTQIHIPVTSTQTSLTVIISSAFNNVLPVRFVYNNSQINTSINGDVVLIETTSTINNISLSFDLKNKTLGNHQCVFWNFNLLNGIGGWDSTGCQLKKLGYETERVTCECNHTTSFSILMSPFTLDENLAIVLDYITYIGVAISMGSLVLCLIIEMITWKSVTKTETSYMRHVSIVNIAVSLLIANICFIIGAAVVKKGMGPCGTATFFMHFFYLALFFWMLLSALLLLYITLMVFSRLTKGAMMAIAFTVGYGAPLIIAVITVASTAGSQGYIQKDYNCWLNWSKTKALLSFVIPALTIVAINLLILIVVLCKMLRRGVNATIQPDEKHPLMIIARCVAILTPLFGLTWGFGIGTMVSPNFGIHVMFAFFNSLQGFFILLFGTLLDRKVREALAKTFSLSNLSSIRTRSMTAGL